VKKTGYCIIADNDWIDFGASAEMATRIYENCLRHIHTSIGRIGFQFAHCPTARRLETQFYPNAVTIIRMVEKMLGLESCNLSGEDFYSHENRFKGPF
jgi:pyruvate dehydrogenase E1 component beta subunit